MFTSCPRQQLTSLPVSRLLRPAGPARTSRARSGGRPGFDRGAGFGLGAAGEGRPPARTPGPLSLRPAGPPRAVRARRRVRRRAGRLLPMRPPAWDGRGGGGPRMTRIDDSDPLGMTRIDSDPLGRLR
jgi:hypothetical protein